MNHEERKAQMREYYQQTRERRLELARKRREEHPERVMYQQVRARAAKKGIPFDIEESDIHIPDSCPVLGIPLIRGTKSRDASPSLDRLVPTEGYTKGNVQVISLRANKIKTDATVEELRMVLGWMEQL